MQNELCPPEFRPHHLQGRSRCGARGTGTRSSEDHGTTKRQRKPHLQGGSGLYWSLGKIRLQVSGPPSTPCLLHINAHTVSIQYVGGGKKSRGEVQMLICKTCTTVQRGTPSWKELTLSIPWLQCIDAHTVTGPGKLFRRKGGKGTTAQQVMLPMK